jgi:hypothetical protein
MQSLHDTVEEILGTGRVGTPVFVRCAVQIATDDERIEDVLVRVLAMTCSWLKTSPLRIYAQSRDGSRQITVTVQYMDGQSAIVSVNAASDVAARVDFMLIGNKGAIYHDGDALSPEFDITAEPLPVPEWLVKAVERSLRIGKSVLIENLATDLH